MTNIPIPQVPLEDQFRSLLAELFDIDVDDVTAIHVTTLRGYGTVDFEMGAGLYSRITYDVTPVGKRGPRDA